MEKGGENEARKGRMKSTRTKKNTGTGREEKLKPCRPYCATLCLSFRTKRSRQTIRQATRNTPPQTLQQKDKEEDLSVCVALSLVNLACLALNLSASSLSSNISRSSSFWFNNSRTLLSVLRFKSACNLVFVVVRLSLTRIMDRH